MIIQCPACGARAKLPDSKEGAKVRCVECERVYVARDSVGRASSGSTKTSSALPIGIGAGVVALIMVLLMIANKNDERGVPDLPEVKEAAPTKVAVDQSGWDSELVVVARKLHDLAHNRDEFQLQNTISWPHVWARTQLPQGEEVPPTLNTLGYSDLANSEIDKLRSDVMASLLAAEAQNLVGSWEPFDGNIISQSDQDAIVRLMIKPTSTDFGDGTRNIEWRLVLDGNRWKAWYWARWISPEELKQERIKQKRSYDQKTLSDGSIVIEGEPKPIPYMDETPMEQRTRIDKLIARLVDPDLPAKELSQVRAELELEGKHAIPGLLTKFYYQNEEGFADMEAAIQAQQVHQMLSDMTGYVTSFKAHDALGATKERRDSGVRQWYGWYNKHFKKFEGRLEETDGLEENLEFKTEAEKREYEKYKRIQEQEAANQNPNKKP